MAKSSANASLSTSFLADARRDLSTAVQLAPDDQSAPAHALSLCLSLCLCPSVSASASASASVSASLFQFAYVCAWLCLSVPGLLCLAVPGLLCLAVPGCVWRCLAVSGCDSVSGCLCVSVSPGAVDAGIRVALQEVQDADAARHR
jgi:hypothetical protein